MAKDLQRRFIISCSTCKDAEIVHSKSQGLTYAVQPTIFRGRVGDGKARLSHMMPKATEQATGALPQ